MLFRLFQNYYAKYLLTICSIVGGYLALVFLDNFHNHNNQTLCLFKLATSIPCPGCGMGRATLALLNGDIPLSFSYNILCIPFTLAIIISLTWLTIDIFSRRTTFFNFVNQDIKKEYKFLLFSLLLIDWTINIIRL